MSFLLFLFYALYLSEEPGHRMNNFNVKDFQGRVAQNRHIKLSSLTLED